MQETTTIARPYARAAFEQAQASNKLGQWSTMLQLLSKVATDTGMQSLIKNPKLDRTRLVELIFEIGGSHLSDQGKNFVQVLINAGRFALAPQISRLFEEQKAQAEGVAAVEVISAYPLEPDQQDKIKQVMAKRLGKKIEITTHVDQSLIGGAVIRAGDSVIDASLRGRLKQLGHNFAE